MQNDEILPWTVVLGDFFWVEMTEYKKRWLKRYVVFGACFVGVAAVGLSFFGGFDFCALPKWELWKHDGWRRP